MVLSDLPQPALIAALLGGLGVCMWARHRMLKTLKPTDPSIWDRGATLLHIRTKDEFIFLLGFFVMMLAFAGLVWPTLE